MRRSGSLIGSRMGWIMKDLRSWGKTERRIRSAWCFRLYFFLCAFSDSTDSSALILVYKSVESITKLVDNQLKRNMLIFGLLYVPNINKNRPRKFFLNYLNREKRSTFSWMHCPVSSCLSLIDQWNYHDSWNFWLNRPSLVISNILIVEAAKKYFIADSDSHTNWNMNQ